MRIIKKIPNHLVHDTFLISELSYKRELVLMNQDGILYQDLNNKDRKKKKVSQKLEFDKTNLYITPEELLMLTPIQKDGKGYMIIEEFDKSNKITEYYFTKEELDNFFIPNQDTIYLYQSHLSFQLPIPTLEEIFENYKKDIRDFIFSNLSIAEKTQHLYETTIYNCDYPDKLKMIERVIAKSQIDSLAPNYNFSKKFGNIIMIKRLNNELTVSILELLYMGEDSYKVVLKNYPINTYASKTFEKSKSLLPYFKL